MLNFSIMTLQWIWVDVLILNDFMVVVMVLKTLKEKDVQEDLYECA